MTVEQAIAQARSFLERVSPSGIESARALVMAHDMLTECIEALDRAKKEDEKNGRSYTEDD